RADPGRRPRHSRSLRTQALRRAGGEAPPARRLFPDAVLPDFRAGEGSPLPESSSPSPLEEGVRGWGEGEHLMTRALAQSLYALFAALYLVSGVSVLLLRTRLLPGPVSDLIVAIAEGNSNTLHVMQEFGTLLIFTGLITLWFVRHYDQSRAFHWAMTVF